MTKHYNSGFHVAVSGIEAVTQTFTQGRRGASMAGSWTVGVRGREGEQMKRKLLASMTVAGALSGTLVGAALTAPAVAQLPPHPHLLVLGLELNEAGEPVGFRKCVELAAGQALPLNTQHEHVHFGHAGEALFTHAGNVVVPAAPFPGVPFSNCAELEALFG
jgi:hypothetical protein